jgi:predicted DNA-binding WGR domain protein
MSSEGAMLTSLCVRLEARSAAHRCFRAYEIELGTDLFGAWMLEMSYGRIGAVGRTKVRSFSTTEEAQAQVRTCLRKRAIAPHRIGVAYRVRRMDGLTTWLPLELADPHRAWFGAVRDELRVRDLP